MFQSVFSEKPANTSIWRAYSFFSASLRVSHAGYASGRGARSVSGGTIPSFFWRSRVRSR